MKIEEYYESINEDNRLVRSNSHKLEFITTTHILDQYINKDSYILDVGAGTGRYSLYYASKGVSVSALDLMPKHIDLLNLKSKELNVSNLFCDVGDACDLFRYQDQSFDAVLCLGPLYHLRDELDRDQCISECLRVLKPNGVLALAYINKYTDYVLKFIRDKAILYKKPIEKFINNETLFNDDRDCFYFTSPTEIEEYMKKFNITKLDNVGTNGIGMLINEEINKLDENEFNLWLEYHFRTFRDPSLLGYSLHGLFICSKNS